MLKIERTRTDSLSVVGEATVYEISVLYEALLNALSYDPPIQSVDLSKLVDVDIAGAQLLLAFRRSLGRPCIEGCPRELRERLLQMGMGALVPDSSGGAR